MGKVRPHCYKKDHASEYEKLKGECEPKLKILNEFLGDKKWFTGDELSAFDFYAITEISLC